MPYIQEICRAGRTIEVTKRYAPRYNKRGLPRSDNQNPTPQDQRAVNLRKAETTLRRLINHNFGPGDLHVVLTYRRGCRPTPEQGRKDLERLHRRLRAYFSRQGQVYKYISVTEYRSKAIHHHLVIPSMDTRDLPALWPHGRPLITPLDDTGQYGQLAAYLIKETSKTFKSHPGAVGKRWCASKNLDKPEVKIKVVASDAWREQPRPLKGYLLERDSIRTGYHEITGYAYQFYRMVCPPPFLARGRPPRRINHGLQL